MRFNRTDKGNSEHPLLDCRRGLIGQVGRAPVGQALEISADQGFLGRWESAALTVIELRGQHDHEVAALIQDVLDRAGGNPFYVGELVRQVQATRSSPRNHKRLPRDRPSEAPSSPFRSYSLEAPCALVTLRQLQSPVRSITNNKIVALPRKANGESQTVMALLVRVYFNAVFGALGGLLGWMLFGLFGDKTSSTVGQQLLGGALIGGFIGYFVVSVEAIRDRSFRRYCRLAHHLCDLDLKTRDHLWRGCRRRV